MRLTKISEEKELLEYHLKDMYSAEKQIVEALPDVIDKVTSSSLAKDLIHHLDETRMHVKRLEEVADILGVGDLSGEKCAGIEGLLDETDEAMKNIDEGDLLDIALVGGNRKVEHYEMLSYADIINHMSNIRCDQRAIKLMQDTLEEEESTDNKLANFE